MREAPLSFGISLGNTEPKDPPWSKKVKEAEAAAIRNAVARRRVREQGTDHAVREALEELWAFSPEARSLTVSEVADRVEELQIQSNQLFKPRQIPERIRPKIREVIAGAVAKARSKKWDRQKSLEFVFGALADAGPISVYPGYSLRLVRITDEQKDTVDQKFY